MHVVGSDDQTRSARANSVLGDSACRGVSKRGVIGKAEIIVRGKTKDRFAIHHDASPKRPFENPLLPKQMRGLDRFQPPSKALLEGTVHLEILNHIEYLHSCSMEPNSQVRAQELRPARDGKQSSVKGESSEPLEATRTAAMRTAASELQNLVPTQGFEPRT